MANPKTKGEVQLKHGVVPTKCAEDPRKLKVTMITSKSYKIVELPFIVSFDGTKADSDTRLFIRSHVMIGKNRGRELPKQRGPRKKKNTKTKSLNPSDSVRVGTIPRWLTSKFSSVRFADDVEPALLEDVLNCAS